MRGALRIVAPLSAALVLVPAAVAATPGTYTGWQVTGDGDRIAKTRTTLEVRPSGRSFELRTQKFKVTCPYLDNDGTAHRKWMKIRFRGRIGEGDVVDDVHNLKGGTQRVRVRGEFTGNRFAGRMSVQSQPRIAGACTGSRRIKVTLAGAVG
jgi:hypothetical protein